METRKIALACFLSAVAFGAIAYTVAPSRLWLATVAGMAVGYLSYRFRQVLTALPKAWRIACELTTACSSGLYRMGKKIAHELLVKSHPVGYLSAAIWIPLGIWVTAYILRHSEDVNTTWFLQLYTVFCMGLAAGVLIWFTCKTLDALCCFGSKGKPRPEHYGYIQAYSDIAKGLGKIMLYLVWGLWRDLFLIVVYLVSFAFIAAWWLVKLIHSHERLLCAVDGTMGGFISYHFLSSTAVTLGEKILVVLCGGILGAALGVLNWELVSKRWLKLARVRG